MLNILYFIFLGLRFSGFSTFLWS